MTEKIENQGDGLKRQVAVLSNVVIRAKCTGDAKGGFEAIRVLADVLANTPGAIDTLSQLQRCETRRIQLSPNARRLISRAYVLGADSVGLKDDLARGMKVAQRVGRERITRGDLTSIATEVRARRIVKMDSYV